MKAPRAGFVAALILLLGASWMSYTNTERLLEAARWSEHTESVIAELQTALGCMTDMETGTRGFALGGDERLLEPYDRGAAEMPAALDTLRSLTADNPRQQLRLAALAPATRDLIAWLGHIITVRRDHGLQAVGAAVATLRGKALMDDVRARLAEMEDEERRLLAERALAVRTTTARANRTLMAGAALGVTLLVGAFLALEREIRERRRAEKEARQARAFLDSVVENIPNMVFVKDAADLRFVRFNRAGEELLGHPRQDLIGRNDYDLFPKEEADFFTAKDRQVLESGSLLDIPEEILQTKDRGARILHTKKVPIPDEAGRPRYLLGISEDISDRKAAQEKIERLNESLRIHSDQLESANRELEAFSYSVSHDLRAPLRHIGGFADLLRQHAAATLDDTGRRFLRTIEESARRMGSLIDDLLVFSRMGRAAMRTASVPLAPLVADVLKELELETRGRSIDWTIAPLPEVQGDPAMLRQALANLIANALKYTRTRPEARIEIGARSAPGETVIFVRDNGVGFDMQYAHKLFGVFQRLHGAEQFEGTGIGLANVRRIVHRHGGRAWAEGAVDGGATFYVSLPARKETAA